MATPTERARVRAAKELSKFSSRSAVAMQQQVAANMEAILQVSATRGRAAGLAALRRHVQAAERQFARAASSGARRAATASIEADVAAATARTLGTRIAAASGARAAKAAATEAVQSATLGRAAIAWRGEMSAQIASMGPVNSTGLFNKLRGVVGTAARQGKGQRLEKSALEKLSVRGRLQVTKQTQISSRRAINMATHQTGNIASIATQAQAKAAGSDTYIWRTVGDDRVREEHAARDGRKYKFSSPPADGNPGEPVNCRCTADVVIDL